ncbi:MAG: hypothetical protein ACI845_000468 [Gammaproteobacteria bacterium]|jgi:hypothetical protein
MHDYLVGVYDGDNLTAQLECDECKFMDKDGNYDLFSHRYRECVRERVLHWVEGPDPDQINQASIQFIRYLYDSEYDKALRGSSKSLKNRNTYIALSQAFGTINKSNAQKVQYADYLNRLRAYSSKLKLEPKSDLYLILHNPETFTARKISKIFENIMQIQDLVASCEHCDGKSLNDVLAKIFKF